jgi:hypothetical protein
MMSAISGKAGRERHNEEQHRGQQAARKTTSLLPWEEESQRPVRALKSKYEVNNPWSTTDLGFTELVPLSHFGEALALSSRHLGSAEETDFKAWRERKNDEHVPYYLK